MGSTSHYCHTVSHKMSVTLVSSTDTANCHCFMLDVGEKTIQCSTGAGLASILCLVECLHNSAVMQGIATKSSRTSESVHTVDVSPIRMSTRLSPRKTGPLTFAPEFSQNTGIF